MGRKGWYTDFDHRGLMVFKREGCKRVAEPKKAYRLTTDHHGRIVLRKARYNGNPNYSRSADSLTCTQRKDITRAVNRKKNKAARKARKTQRHFKLIRQQNANRKITAISK